MARPSLFLARNLLLTFAPLLALPQDQACAGGPDTFGIRTVVLSGQPVPGLASTFSFSDFSIPFLSEAGDVRFIASLMGPGFDSSNASSAWLERDGQLELILRQLAPVPPPNADRLFRSFGSPVPLPNGEALISAAISPSLSVSAVWRATSQGLQQVSGPGFPVPGSDGSPMAGFSWTSMSLVSAHSSDVMLLYGNAASSRGAGNKTGYWLMKEGVIALEVDYDAVPGAPSAAGFSPGYHPALNRHGQIAFYAHYINDPFAERLMIDAGIWTNRDGDLAILAHEGWAATEFGPNATYSGFGLQQVAFNDRGQILFQANVTGGEMLPSGQQGLILDDGVSRRIVARTGASAPGSGPDLVFDRLDLGQRALNGQGQVAFSARVTGFEVFGNSVYGIWLERFPGQLEPVVRGGEPAPGGGFFHLDRQQPFVLNQHGQIAFAADLTANGGVGIWATDQLGDLQLIARKGSQIEVAPGDVRTVAYVNFPHHEFQDQSSGLEDGRSAAFNNRGEVAFYAVFEDGTRGLFVSSLVAIPEPSTLALSLTLAAAPLLRRPRRGTGQFG